MKKWISALLIGCTCLSFTACDQMNPPVTTQSEENSSDTQPVAEVQSMSGDELVALMEDTARFADVLLVDVRSAQEYEAGHIDGSTNFPIDEIESRVSEIESYKDKEIVLYCNTGNRSGTVAQFLVNNGFTKVYNADGVKQYNYNLVR